MGNSGRRFQRAGAIIVALSAIATSAIAISADAAPTKKPAPKKGAPATARNAPAPPPRAPELRVLEHAETFTTDYQAEVFSGVPLTDPYAKERGLEHGLVWMAFENARQLGFRVPKEKLRHVVRLVVDDDPRTPPGFALAQQRNGILPVMISAPAADTVPRSYPKDRVDVLDTTMGTVVVMTSTSNAGIFTSSDVYAFPKGTHEGDLAFATHAPSPHKDRIHEALATAHAVYFSASDLAKKNE